MTETTVSTPTTTDLEARRAARRAAVARAVAAVAALDALDAESDGVAESDLAHDFLDRQVEAGHEAIASLRDVVSQIGPRARAAATPRQTLEKADPTEVAAFFTSTGLTRKELAAAAGVSTSVIATVQNEKGDRWSTVTFEAKKALIAQWITDHEGEIKTRQAADAAAQATKDAAAAAKVAKAAAKASPKSTPAPKASAASAPSPKPGRPSKAARAANRKNAAQPVAQVATA